MSLDEFWEIFALYGEGKDSDAKRLMRGRRKAYSQHFDDCLRRAHTWDLWGAAYIVYGGCSDDSFTDFKGGLLLQGRKVFESVLDDPESLIELSEQIDLETLLDSEFGGSGTDEPSGERWSEDGDDLKNRFPRLWEKFSNDPVGLD